MHRTSTQILQTSQVFLCSFTTATTCEAKGDDDDDEAGMGNGDWQQQDEERSEAREPGKICKSAQAPARRFISECD